MIIGKLFFSTLKFQKNWDIQNSYRNGPKVEQFDFTVQ